MTNNFFFVFKDTGSCTGSIYWLGGLKNSSKVTWVTSKSDVPVLPEQGYSKWSTHEPTLDVTGFDCMLWVFTGWKVYTCNEPKCTICKADDCIYQTYSTCYYKLKTMFDVSIMDGNSTKNFFIYNVSKYLDILNTTPRLNPKYYFYLIFY